jgi:alpha-glucosidase
MMLMTLRGTAVLYYGDEVGMTDAEIDREQVLDPVGVRYHPFAGRDPERTPMPWSDDPGAGFTDPMARPWLPIGDLTRNVEDQRDDPRSILHLCRDLIALRRELLHDGVYQPLDAPDGVWAWRRGEDLTVALNLSEGEQTLDGVKGTVRLATNRTRDGESVTGRLRLGPAEGAIIVS